MRTRLFAVVAAIAAAAAAGAAAVALAGGDPLVTCEGCDSFTVDWTNGPQQALQFDVDQIVGDVAITGLTPGAPEPFDVYAYNWGVSQTTVAPGGGGGGAGRAEFQALSFVKAIDHLSPLFAEACATGEHFPRARLEAAAKEGTMAYELEDVTCALDKHGSTGEKNDLPIETWSLGYAKIEWTFSPKKGEDVQTCYDLRLNRRC